MGLKGGRFPASCIPAVILGGIMFLASGVERAHWVSDLLFALGSGALIVGIIALLGNLKMFASLSWGTRMLKRIFLNRMRGGREETEDYLAFRSRPASRADAVPLLIASAVFILLSLIWAGLT